MSNSYFDWPAKLTAERFVRFDTVRSRDVNDALDLVSAGFEKMPSPYKINAGSGNYAADTGVADAYVVALSTQIDSYQPGLTVKFKTANSNTGASTLNVNGLGAKAIVQPDGASDLLAGHILAGQMVEVQYDGTRFQLKSSPTAFTNDPSAIQRQTYTAVTTGGSGFAYTVSPAPAWTGYVGFQSTLFVTFHASCGGLPTINVSGLGPVSLVKQAPDGSFVNISFGEITVGHRSRVTMVSSTQALVETMPQRSACNVNGFRLTLTSGTPVPTADVIGASTLYAAPYKSNEIALYVNGAWRVHSSAQFSRSLAGILIAGRPYDVFYYSNAGVPAIELGAWSSDTARSTALAYQDGVLVKSGDPTRRYAGTFYATSADTTEDSEANRYLWNHANRVRRSMRAFDATDSWTYSTGAWRQSNNNPANQLNFVVGVAEDSVNATAVGRVGTNGATYRLPRVGIGYDSVTAFSGLAPAIAVDNLQALTAAAFYEGQPSAGRHYLAWLEHGGGADTQTWHGDGGTPSSNQYGIVGSLFA